MRRQLASSSKNNNNNVQRRRRFDLSVMRFSSFLVVRKMYLENIPRNFCSIFHSVFRVISGPSVRGRNECKGEKEEEEAVENVCMKLRAPHEKEGLKCEKCGYDDFFQSFRRESLRK